MTRVLRSPELSPAAFARFEKERRDADPFNPDNVFDLTAKWNRPGRVHGSGYPRPVVGAGRKNPNVAPSLPSGAGGEGDV